MAAIVIRGNARAAWLSSLARLRVKVCNMAQRVTACAAAAVMVCAVGAALLQLAAQILSFSAPIAVTGIAVMAAALLRSLRRHHCLDRCGLVFQKLTRTCGSVAASEGPGDAGFPRDAAIGASPVQRG